MTIKLSSPSLRASLLLTTVAWLTACAGNGSKPYDDAGFRADRAAETAAVVAFENCHKDALELDNKAQHNTSVAQYRRAARAFEACLSEA